MDIADRHELAAQLESALTHLSRYEDGSARDSMGEMDAAKLLITRVVERLIDDEGE